MSKKIELIPKFDNFRDLLENSTNCFGNNVAYKYKKNINKKPVEYVEKTYATVGEDVKALSEAFLNYEKPIKRIALIGNNRYEWVVSYFATVCGGMIIAPMDKMLPENEIVSLIERSEVDVAIFDKKYLEIFKKIKNNKSNKLHTLICMDHIDDSEIVYFNDLLEKGKDLRAKESKDIKKYDNITIDNDAMSIMLFTSGTTDLSKIVMLSQKNICNNVYAYQNHFKMLPTDTLL